MPKAKTAKLRKKPQDRGKGLGGMPRFAPTDDQRKTVEAMAGYGIPHEDIALVIGVSNKTLRLRCRLELDTGHIKANSRVAESLFKQAVGEAAVIHIMPDGSHVTAKERVAPVPAAAIWWTKARMGWSETNKYEHTFDLSKLNDSELDALENLVSKTSAAGLDKG